MWKPDQPYNDLPMLPPTCELESSRVLRACIGARVALAELKQASALIPNQAVLINTLPILEAQSSSEIENIVTTKDRLFQHVGAAEASADPATKEALRYRNALMEGFTGLASRPLSTGTAETVCSRIKGAKMQIRQVPGIALAEESTGAIIYTPPQGERTLHALLANWERFLHEQPDLDPLVRLAVAHYQFEAIHPFTDGNGRTGRILNSLYLVETKLLTLPVLYLSRYIIAHKSEYYRLLLDVTRAQAWEAWLLYMMKAIEDTSRWTSAKITAIRNLAESTRKFVKEKCPKIYSHELIDVIFEQPYCRIGNLGAAGIAKRQTASRYLKELAAIGILREKTIGREKLFIQPRLMKLLTTDENDPEPYSG